MGAYARARARARALNHFHILGRKSEGNLKIKDMDSSRVKVCEQPNLWFKTLSHLLMEILRVIYSLVNQMSHSKTPKIPSFLALARERKVRFA